MVPSALKSTLLLMMLRLMRKRVKIPEYRLTA